MMEDQLVAHLSKYVELTPTLEAAIKESAFVRLFPKGNMLLNEGELSNECFFIFKGCIRSYYIDDAEEKTVEIYTEEQPVTPPSYGKEVPSKLYLECVEETVASVGTPQLETEMFRKYHQLESLALVMNNMIVSQQQESIAEFKFSSPEERYLQLLENRPDLMQRIPLHQIASYLGITPESLSRIRKRLLKT